MRRIRFGEVLNLAGALLLAAAPWAIAAETGSGVVYDAVVTGMAQQVGPDGTVTGHAESRLNYRGDLAVTSPAGTLSATRGTLFVHLRFGQGSGIGLRPTYTSTANTTTFELPDPDDPDRAFAVLAQVWYQLDIPLAPQTRALLLPQRLSVDVGKIDPFVFFDQNVAAEDEGLQFVNNAFVHNPLLDSGGDAGVDAYGFTPGVRIAARADTMAGGSWSASLAVFGSGEAARLSGPASRPFMIGQIETSTSLVAHRPGTYRLYLWRNGRAEDFDEVEAAHGGWGLSADQRLGEALTLFGRYGDRVAGRGAFDRALTLGAELGGSRWRRNRDAIGVGAAWLRTSGAFRAATADGRLTGYAASGTERIVEIYCRVSVNDHLALTPDLQWIGRAGGDAHAPAFTIVGLRLRVAL